MIQHDFIPERGLLIVRPAGPLTREDFRELARSVDPFLEKHGRLEGLLIDAPRFPGWADLAGLLSHLQFIHGHHRRIRRVAAVTDEPLARFIPALARHFVEAELRRFGADEREAALAWLEGAEPPPLPASGQVRFATLSDQSVVWLEVSGRLTRDAYRAWVKEMEPRLEDGPPVSFLVELKELEGAEPGAVWEDLKFGLRHFKQMKRVAVLADRAWIARSTRLAALLSPVEIRVFPTEEELEAWEWVTGHPAPDLSP